MTLLMKAINVVRCALLQQKSPVGVSRKCIIALVRSAGGQTSNFVLGNFQEGCIHGQPGLE